MQLYPKHKQLITCTAENVTQEGQAQCESEPASPKANTQVAMVLASALAGKTRAAQSVENKGAEGQVNSHEHAQNT